MVSPAFRALSDELVEVFRRGTTEPMDDEAFGDLALRVFRYQFRENGVYAGFCRRRGVDPDSVSHWTEVPAVPTRAFKALKIVSGPPDEVDVVFRTSGTSRGAEARGEHHVLDLRLYRESLIPNFRDHLLADGARLPLVCLIPNPVRAPDSSLSHMMGVVEEELAAEGGGWFVDPDRGLLEEELARALAGLEDRSIPILLCGTAFSFVHWLDAMEENGWRFVLPEGSRIMETGGFKGRSRTVSREELHRGLSQTFGVPREEIVNEYGMTELLSQFYDSHDGPHRPPPWVRTRILDPVTLESKPTGETGILCHHDLANLGSVAVVLTEDLGVEEDGGFRVLGRASGAEPRGCSLAMDDLLASVP
ncbi:MAG: hypothetical protein R3223_02150 [Longimicrobiales bacterium]|nr:hypothetical protein [Longimicrobiales bacterium]